MGKSRAINIHEAKTHFSKLLQRVARGESVRKFAAQVNPTIARTRTLFRGQKRCPSLWRGPGRFVIPDAFDDQLLQTC